MELLGTSVLRRLGIGERIDEICETENWTRAQFDVRWKNELTQRTQIIEAAAGSSWRSGVSIERDKLGIPHIFARSNQDLWFGFGVAMAQDRLFQLDFLRRKGLGKLAEILGQDGWQFDLVARTVGLNRIAQAELQRLPEETRGLLDQFSQGINAWMQHVEACLPIEFALLDYRPEPWSVVDCLAIESEFRWYLTGRFPVIAVPEHARRILGDGPLFQEFCLASADDEAIVPPEAYRDLLSPQVSGHVNGSKLEAVGQATGDPEGTGSNNWVVAGRHCRTGLPLVASDPHIAFEAVSCWYEARLCGGDFNVAGMAYVGIPAIMFGRNEKIAWGATNNICSQRDLYQERTSPQHPNCFEYDGRWETARELTENIIVRGQSPIAKRIRFSRNGPVVNEILPKVGDEPHPVTLKWLGAYQGGWLTALLAMDRANNVSEFREALRPWHVPTFNLVIADVHSRIAMQSAGRIPLRKKNERGFRKGWDPDDQWLGLIPFEHMPHAIDPDRGWMATANNRLAGNDYPYPLFGTWTSGYRGKRIRQMIETHLADQARGTRPGFAVDDFRHMQHDTLSLRALECRDPLVSVLANSNDKDFRNSKTVSQAIEVLRQWDCRIEVDLVAPTIFNVFYTLWTRAAAGVRLKLDANDLVARQMEAFAGRLLAEDRFGWFGENQRTDLIIQVFRQTLDNLTEQFGNDIAEWKWGRLHLMPLTHVLAIRGDLGQLLTHGNQPAKGDMMTVCNTGSSLTWLATSGAGYRLIADLSTNKLYAVDAQSQSGNPGSSHYGDQFSDWESGRYHELSLDRKPS